MRREKDNMSTMVVGNILTACESSPHKSKIDDWLNENKSFSWISRELKSKYNENISDRSIAKYARYRREYIVSQVESNPLYQAKMIEMEENFNTAVAKIEHVDTVAELKTIIEDASSLLSQAKLDEIKITDIKEYRMVAQTMLDAVKLYGDTILKAQRYAAIQDDPELLKPTTINVSVKSTLADILGKAVNDGAGFELVDKLRAGINGNNEMDSGTVEEEV